MVARVHRAEQGRAYMGLAIHAADGVHEHAAALCSRAAAPGASILEVGAGSGALAQRLKDSGFHVVATDLEPAADWIQRLDLDDASELSAGVELVDVVVCIETLEHVENPRAAIRQMRQLLVDDGLLIISVPNVNHLHSRLLNLFKGVPILFGPETYYESGHITMLPLWLLVEHLRDSGFEVVGVSTAGLFGFSTRRRKAAHQLEMGLLRLVTRSGNGSNDDGVCAFVTARKT